MRLRIQYFGSFGIWAEDGTPVLFATRHAKAAVAIIAKSPRLGISRSELADALWPACRSDESLAKLRVALSHVRKALGSEAISRQGSQILLGSTIEIDSDLETGSGEYFMPGFEADWFTDQREEKFSATGFEDGQSSPYQSFCSLVDWYARRDPVRAIGLMRENPGLAFGMTSKSRKQLCQELKIRAVGTSSIRYYLGLDEIVSGRLDAGVVICDEIIRTALKSGDRDLAGMAASFLVVGFAFGNRPDQALNVARWQLAEAQKVNSRKARAISEQLFAYACISSGSLSEAVRHMMTSAEEYEDFVDASLMRSLTCLYLAVQGSSDAAQDVMFVLQSSGALELDHPFIQATISQARGLIAYGSDNLQKAQEEFCEALRIGRRTQNNTLISFSLDALAATHKRMGNVVAAQQKRKDLLAFRESAGLAFSGWDAAVQSRLRQKKIAV